MFILGGFRRDSIQETHPWHCYRKFDPGHIDLKMAISNIGNEEHSFRRHFLFLFHAPILGGWKNYIALRPVSDDRPFYVGWLVRNTKTNELLEIAINKLPIHDDEVRLLNGPPHYSVYFFVLNASGQQAKAKLIGKGRLGDNKYPNSRLF